MRLIDADQVIAAIKSCNNMGENAPTWRSKDVVTLLENAPTPPNDPLTLEELREMDGEPVWVVQTSGKLRPFWMLVDTEDESAANRLYAALFEDCGTEWLAYRRRPEEGAV